MSNSTGQPSTSVTTPTSSTQPPTSNTQPSTSTSQLSTGGNQSPASGVEPSISGIHPSTSSIHPSISGTHPPNSGAHPSTSSTNHSSVVQVLDDNASCASELQNLVHELLDKQENPPVFITLNEALIHLNSKLHDRERLLVDQSCVLEEALAYYKSPEFQPYGKMIIQYKGQSAIDTGRVLREFFTDVFTKYNGGWGRFPTTIPGICL